MVGTSNLGSWNGHWSNFRGVDQESIIKGACVKSTEHRVPFAWRLQPAKNEVELFENTKRRQSTNHMDVLQKR